MVAMLLGIGRGLSLNSSAALRRVAGPASCQAQRAPVYSQLRLLTRSALLRQPAAATSTTPPRSSASALPTAATLRVRTAGAWGRLVLRRQQLRQCTSGVAAPPFTRPVGVQNNTPTGRREMPAPAAKKRERGMIIDNEGFQWEPESPKTRFYDWVHQGTVLSIFTMCCLGLIFVTWCCVQIHTQGHRVELIMSRCKYVKDVLRQYRVLVPFNEANMNLQPLLRYYEPLLREDGCLYYEDLEEEPIYATLHHRYYDTPQVFDWLNAGKSMHHDYCVTLGLITYFARQPMREETNKRIRTIGDDFFLMLKSMNEGTPQEGTVTFENMCSFAAAAFATGSGAPPNLGGMSWPDFRKSHVATLLCLDDIPDPNMPVTRRQFSRLHGNLQYHLGLVPKKYAKNRAARQI